jgi:hypothetical protein
MIPWWVALFELGFLLVLGLVPGVLARAAIGWSKGRLGAALGSGGIGGVVGGVIGFLLYRSYLATLPSKEVRDVFGPSRQIIDPPPLYVGWLSIIGGSLIVAILCTAVFVKRPAAPTSNAPDG